MTLAPPAPLWPARVIAVATHPFDIARGRPAEFRQRGVLLDGTPSISAALVEIGRHPDALVLVPSDLGDMSVLDFIDVVCAFADRRLIVGVASPCEESVVAAAIEHGAVATVDLPVTPSRLLSAVNDARPPAVWVPDVLEIGALQLDLTAHRITWHGVEVHLAPRPFDVLRYLMAAHPRIVSLPELASQFGGSTVRDRGERARVSLGRIRQLFGEAHPAGLQPVETVHRVGYRISPGGVPAPSQR